MQELQGGVDTAGNDPCDPDGKSIKDILAAEIIKIRIRDSSNGAQNFGLTETYEKLFKQLQATTPSLGTLSTSDKDQVVEDEAKSEASADSSDEAENNSPTPPLNPEDSIITKGEFLTLKGLAADAQEQAENCKTMLDELRMQYEAMFDAFGAQKAKFVKKMKNMIDIRVAEELKHKKELDAEVLNTRKERAKVDELTMKWKEEHNERKQLFNTVQDLRGNIRVFCRVRPLKSDHGTVAAFFPDSDDAEPSLIKFNDECFKYSRVLGPEASQEEVYGAACGVVGSVLDGYNVCIFAYGQTGSGKTHTMTGTKNDRGVNFRALKDLFRIAGERSKFFKMTCSVSMFEVYNETLRDLLLKKKKRRKDAQPPRMLHHVRGMTRIECSSADVVWEVMESCSKHRAVAATNMNPFSSRSHLIMRVEVEMKELKTSKSTRSLLTLVDLAGSENDKRTGVSGQGRLEASHINTSILALRNVFLGLFHDDDHVRWADSKLTTVLKDSMCQNSKTCMFVNISADDSDTSESINSLKFAEAVAQVQFSPGKKKANEALAKKAKGINRAKSGSDPTAKARPAPAPISHPIYGTVPTRYRPQGER